MSKPKIYRLSFDFGDAESMRDFWLTFQDDNQGSDGDWNKVNLVHKDSLHDQSVKVHEFLIRDEDEGNGRPVEYLIINQPNEVTIKGL